MGYILVTDPELALLLNTMNDDDHFLGKYMTITVKGLSLNGNNWRLKVRIPTRLLPLYGGKTHLTEALKTNDKNIAHKRALVVYRAWQTEFKAQLKALRSQANGSTPTAIPRSAMEQVRKTWEGSEEFLISDIQDRYYEKITEMAGGDLSLGERLDEEGVLEPWSVASPAEVAHLANKGLILGGQRLSDALRVYLETYTKDVAKVSGISTLAINTLIKSIGSDLPLTELKRTHLKKWIEDSGKNEGHSSGTIKRRLNAIKAVLRVASAEFEVSLGNALEVLKIPNLGNDAKERYRPSMEDIKAILELFKDDPLVTLVVLFGGRISELAGLRMQDVHLEGDHPFLAIVPHARRSLKTKNSERDFPLIGLALEAVSQLVAKGEPNREALLTQYFGGRGGDNLGGLIKRRLAKAGYSHITSHCWRHSMKDLLLREALISTEIADALQGHGRLTEGSKYGRGFRLEPLSNALEKAYALIDAA